MGLGALSTTINTALSPSDPPFSLCIFFQLSVARSRFLAWPNSCAMRSHPPRATRPSFEPFGLAVAEGREGTVGLKSESSISYFRVNALECLRAADRTSYWLTFEHEHRRCSLSSLLHHDHPYNNASLVTTTVLVCLGSASMCRDLANRRNASQ
jgi:hypothetical protein